MKVVRWRDERDTRDEHLLDVRASEEGDDDSLAVRPLGLIRLCVSAFMHSSSSNNRGSNPRSRQPHIDSISPHPHPQPVVSSPFVQSPQAFPSAFLTPQPQYDYPSQPSNLLPPNWQRPRATSSYTLESATLAFPEPHLHRATSTRAQSRPPSPSPRTSGYDLGVSPPITPALSHRDSFISPKPHTKEVAFWLHLETCLMYFLV